VPTPQPAHVDWPGVSVNDPGSQLEHTVAPVTPEYLPRPHAVHDAAPVSAVAFPSSQPVQVDEPVEAAYEPGLQPEHEV